MSLKTNILFTGSNLVTSTLVGACIGSPFGAVGGLAVGAATRLVRALTHRVAPGTGGSLSLWIGIGIVALRQMAAVGVVFGILALKGFSVTLLHASAFTVVVPATGFALIAGLNALSKLSPASPVPVRNG